MSELHASYGSPHIGKIGYVDPDNVMRKLLADIPSLKQNQKLASQQLVEEALGSLGEYVPSDLLMAMLMSEATRSFWRVTTKLPKLSKKQNERDIKRVKEAKAKQTKEAKKILQHILLSTVRIMTGAECAAAAKSSRGYARIAQKVKPNQIVGDVLTDAQIVKELRGK